VEALLVEAEFDTVIDTVQPGFDAIEFTASGSLAYCNVSVDFFVTIIKNKKLNYHLHPRYA